ncbi:MAG TPA: hypothetical protein VMU49_09470 [Candidatus Acidoferrales bacterium]|nr:hypothetical protein [Candidatus Acidoferrales bacterium]
MRRRALAAGIILVAVLTAAAVQSRRPLPAPTGALLLAASHAYGATKKPPWPATGEAAIGADGLGLWAASASPRALPIASLAKVMTALVALEARPLSPGQGGGTVTVSAADAATYQAETSAGQSTVVVRAGEQLTELQLLQGMLIPSGNNFAALLADYAAGSVGQMVQRMNLKARTLGLSKTHFDDVSGISTRTVSVPADLVRLGELALANPVIAQVVGMAQAVLPVAGVVYNVNYALGRDGILGIKTGSDPAAGACYLFAANWTSSSGRSHHLVGAIEGMATLDGTFAAAQRLLDAARANLVVEHLVAAKQKVGTLSAAWGSKAGLLSPDDLSLALWPGEVVRTRLVLKANPAPLARGSVVGHLEVSAGPQSVQLPLATSSAIASPSRLWRILRIA